MLHQWLDRARAQLFHWASNSQKVNRPAEAGRKSDASAG